MYQKQPKIGILGGGQLGKMLCLASMPWHLEVYILDKKNDYPAAPYCYEFVEGDFSDYDQVVAFGENMDIITIEIEGVNSAALHELKRRGKKVFPDPAFLDMVKDKALQNQFFKKHQLPTTRFSSFESKTEFLASIESGDWNLPLVWKSRFEGYDGRGVCIVKTEEDLESIPESKCIVEELISIDKELALIISRNANGQKAIFGAVEMVFEEKANLLDSLLFPADIPQATRSEMRSIATQLVDSIGYRGILAIEFFLDKTGRLLINEMAPRPHNSGHHTIECCVTNQYEQLMRTVLNLPPGDTTAIQNGVMFNLLGDKDYTGPSILEGLEEIFSTENVHLHWYGKKETRPYRKMGHVVVAGKNMHLIKQKASELKNKLKVVS
jgi:5-(carboxyamino)imidazole ribonucleotide synthase